MAAQLIAGSQVSLTADRGGITPMFPAGTAIVAGTLGTIGSWGSAIAIQDNIRGQHPREVTAWLVTHLNGGTTGAGAFTLDVSHDGVSWIDSGVSAVTVGSADGQVVVAKLSVYVAAQILPARYVRVHISTAFTIGSGVPTFDCWLVV